MTHKPDSVEFLGLDFEVSTFPVVLSRLLDRDPHDSFAYLATPNVDHVVRLHDTALVRRDDIWQAYEDAAWLQCDSRILSRLAKWRKLTIPVVTGSDLTRALLEQLEPGSTVAVIGGSSELPARLRERYPNVRVLQHQAPMGLLHNVTALDEAADFAAECNARFTLIAVGSPQQELLAHAIKLRPGATGLGLCIGASLDFLTGEQVRAPVFFQKAGIEWLFRLGSNPRRFWRRYLVEGPKIFQLWWRDSARPPLAARPAPASRARGDAD